MASSVKVDFYRVRIEPGAATFETLLGRINDLNQRQRNLRVRGDVLRLHSLAGWHQCREGDVTRIRLTDLPSKANLEGEVTDIGLEDDEGLGEHAAFIYHPGTQVLVLQRNRHSVTGGNFAYYMGEKGHLESPLFLDPVLQENAVRRLADFREIQRFVVQFAKVDNVDQLRAGGRSTQQLIDVLDYFRAPNAQIVMSMGRRRGSLPVNLVKDAARALFGGGRNPQHNEVTRIEIKGRDEDGDPDILDLVKFRMVEVIRVVAEGRQLPYAVRRDALREAFSRRREELGRMFRN